MQTPLILGKDLYSPKIEVRQEDGKLYYLLELGITQDQYVLSEKEALEFLELLTQTIHPEAVHENPKPIDDSDVYFWFPLVGKTSFISEEEARAVASDYVYRNNENVVLVRVVDYCSPRPVWGSK